MMIMHLMKRLFFMAIFANFLTGCATNNLPPIQPVAQVNLEKFMGDWYVIAAIPTAIEKEAYNAVESYQRNPDGTIATTFTFNQGSLDGKIKTYHPKGFVVPNSGNARWGMQFVWPIKAEYLIAFLDEQYSQTIIARNARDYVWIMARTPQISNQDYENLTRQVTALGYDISKLRQVPHRPQ